MLLDKYYEQRTSVYYIGCMVLHVFAEHHKPYVHYTFLAYLSERSAYTNNKGLFVMYKVIINSRTTDGGPSHILTSGHGEQHPNGLAEERS